MEKHEKPETINISNIIPKYRVEPYDIVNV